MVWFSFVSCIWIGGVEERGQTTGLAPSAGMSVGGRAQPLSLCDEDGDLIPPPRIGYGPRTTKPKAASGRNKRTQHVVHAVDGADDIEEGDLSKHVPHANGSLTEEDFELQNFESQGNNSSGCIRYAVKIAMLMMLLLSAAACVAAIVIVSPNQSDGYYSPSVLANDEVIPPSSPPAFAEIAPGLRAITFVEAAAPSLPPSPMPHPSPAPLPPPRTPPSIPPASPSAPPLLPPVLPPVPSPSMPPMHPFCIVGLRATGVTHRDEGLFGTTDPVLWVFQRRGDFATVQRTREQLDTLSPNWPERFCLPYQSNGRDERPCFQIRDDYDPHFPPDRPPLLHEGCTHTDDWGSKIVDLSNGAKVFYMVLPEMPMPPPAPPAIPSPTSPPPHHDVAVRLNERFRNGGAGNNLATAGVLVHQFDGMDDPNPDHNPWSPGARHSETGDRISAALINARMQADPGFNIPIYSYSLAGIIMSPAANRLLCSYPYDVGSVGRRCWPRGVSDHCIPGCSRFDNDDNPWCQPGSDQWKHEHPACAWRPENLDAMMRAREEVRSRELRPPQKMWNDGKYYNELIFDAKYYQDHLPDSIEAVFYLDDNCGDAYDGPKCRDYGFGAQRAITRHFGLGSDRIPLLKLDLWNWNEPFSRILSPFNAPAPTPPPPAQPSPPPPASRR